MISETNRPLAVFFNWWWNFPPYLGYWERSWSVCLLSFTYSPADTDDTRQAFLLPFFIFCCCIMLYMIFYDNWLSQWLLFCFLSFATSPTMIPAWSFVCGLPKKVVPIISVRGFVWIPQKLWLIIVFRAKIASTIFTYDNWLVIRNIFYFSIYWELSSQLTFIFCRGVGIPPTREIGCRCPWPVFGQHHTG